MPYITNFFPKTLKVSKKFGCFGIISYLCLQKKTMKKTPNKRLKTLNYEESLTVFDFFRNKVYYDGKEYPIRTVWFSDYNTEVIVSVTALSHELFGKHNNWVNSLAEYIDNKIIYYVEEEEILKEDKYLQHLLKTNIL